MYSGIATISSQSSYSAKLTNFDAKPVISFVDGTSSFTQVQNMCSKREYFIAIFLLKGVQPVLD
jgi:hypothetical protein